MRPLTKISLFGIRLATCVLVVYWLGLFTGTHLPPMPGANPRLPDKLLHFAGFYGLATLLCWVIPTRTIAVQKFALVASITLSYAAFDELSQGFVRGRTTDILDFAADAAGMFSAIGVYAAMRALIHKLWKWPLGSIVADTETGAADSTDDLFDAGPTLLGLGNLNEPEAKTA